MTTADADDEEEAAVAFGAEMTCMGLPVTEGPLAAGPPRALAAGETGVCGRDDGPGCCGCGCGGGCSAVVAPLTPAASPTRGDPHEDAPPAADPARDAEREAVSARDTAFRTTSSAGVVDPSFRNFTTSVWECFAATSAAVSPFCGFVEGRASEQCQGRG